MSDPRPTTGQAIAGMFMVLFGTAVALLGGSCTVMSLSVVAQGGAFLMLLSLAVLAGGCCSIWAGAKILRGHMRS